MKEGDLVKVRDLEGYTMGYGIVADMDTNLNEIMSFGYANVWIFKFTASQNLPDKCMFIKLEDLSVIRNYEDW